MSNEAPSAQNWAVQVYEEAWLESVRSVLEQVAGPGCTIERLPVSEPDGAIFDSADGGLWFRFVAARQLAGEHVLFVPASEALRLAQAGIAEPSEGDAISLDSHRPLLTKIFSQIAEAVAAGLRTKLGWEVDLTLEETTRPSWPPAILLAFQVDSPRITPVRLYSFVSSELELSLRQAASSFPPDLPRESEGTNTPRAASGPDDGRDAVMERLMDAELEAVLHFGERQMLLREILELNSGSVVELDHQIQDPVELLVAGRVFARGEVVVVDGNYGLRITEIVRPQQRVDFLRK